jgi:hypothetical protein
MYIKRLTEMFCRPSCEVTVKIFQFKLNNNWTTSCKIVQYQISWKSILAVLRFFYSYKRMLLASSIGFCRGASMSKEGKNQIFCACIIMKYTVNLNLQCLPSCVEWHNSDLKLYVYVEKKQKHVSMHRSTLFFEHWNVGSFYLHGWPHMTQTLTEVNWR